MAGMLQRSMGNPFTTRRHIILPQEDTLYCEKRKAKLESSFPTYAYVKQLMPMRSKFYFALDRKQLQKRRMRHKSIVGMYYHKVGSSQEESGSELGSKTCKLGDNFTKCSRGNIFLPLLPRSMRQHQYYGTVLRHFFSMQL